MKVSNETKVGVLTITALTVLVLGFNFLKGNTIFRKSKKIYAVFRDLGSLSKSNVVKINGYIIGNVYDITAKDKDLSGIIATIHLTQDINIPVDSRATISSPPVGAAYINIIKGNSKEMLKAGDTLNTIPSSDLLNSIRDQLSPVSEKLKNSLDSLSMVLSNFNKTLSEENRAHLQQILINLNKTSRDLNRLLDAENSILSRTLQNAESFSQTLKNSSDDLKTTIAMARKTVEKLSEVEVEPTLKKLDDAISEFRDLTKKIQSNQGTLGALINDKTLYKKLNDAALSLEILLDDLRTQPKRYVNISIFGRKDKKGPITSPLPKDTIR
ncbi:MAG: MlaD family protein [Chitinophagaceae bacterium]|nr:MlaD family protein [Chitinophagaceae bacterium]